MKKTITLFILLFTLSIGQMWGGTFTSDGSTYFYFHKTHYYVGGESATIDYSADGAVIWVYMWNDDETKTAWYKASLASGDIWRVQVTDEATFTKFIILRKDPVGTNANEKNWNDVWNKTADYDFSDNKNYKTTDGWESYGSPSLVGDFNSSNAAANEFRNGSTRVVLEANHVYTVNVLDGTTSYGKGVAVVTSSISNYTLTSGEAAVRITTAGAGTYTFAWDDTNKQLSVTYPSINHPSIDYCYVIEYPWSNRYINIWGSASGKNGTTYPGMSLTNKCPIGNSNYYYFAYGDYAQCEPNDNGDNKTTQYTSEGHGKYLENVSSTWGWHNWSFTVTLDEQATTLTAPSDPTVEFNGATLTNITPPTRVDAFFEGYWSNAACDETQVINRDGSWVANAAGYTSDSKWIHEGGTATLYAKWSSMLLLYQSEGFPLTSFTDQSKALYIDKAYFAEARPGNRIKIDGHSVTSGAKFFFGDFDHNHIPGSDFREVPTGSDVLPVYIYLTQEMIDYIKTHDLRIYGENMTVNRVELEVGRADEYDSQPQKVIWMGDYSANDLNTLNICIKGLDVTWSDYANMIIYHNAGTKDYSFNVRTNWDDVSGSGIISFWKNKNHITQEKNFTVVDLVHSDASTVIGETPDRLFIQRDDHAGGGRTPFTITSIVLEKSNTTNSSTWSDATWSLGHAPTTDECAVITAPMTVNVTDAKAGRVLIDQSSSNTGKLTIQPNIGLDVRLTVKKTTDGSTLETTSPADLVLESSSDGNASLIFENDENQATVQMYSKAYIDGETWNWQFMGIPFTSTNALYSYYNSYLYEWQSSGTWTEVAKGASMSPFTGYCITQDAATTYVMDGTLNPTTSHTFSVPEGVEMVFANSWTAPIYVGAITDEAFEITRKEIYLFNTGYKPEGSGGATANDGKDKYESGTYLTLPIHSAKYTGDSLIAPMQGFYVDNRAGSAGSITLSYDAVVRPSGTRNIAAGPMHAPKRTQAQQADNHPVVLKIWANGAVYNDRAVLLERSDFSLGFDNGWDGKKLSFGEVGPSVYVINTLGEPEAVSAIPDLEGTLVGFRSGTNNTCTMSFEYNGEDTFYLNDLQSQQSTQIASENSYTFTCTTGDNEARFVISATPIAKTPTDIGPGADSPSTLTRKILLNDHIYIIREGRMFSMDGRLVK